MFLIQVFLFLFFILSGNFATLTQDPPSKRVKRELIQLYNLFRNESNEERNDGIWPDTTIPYTIEGDLDKSEVELALADFEKNTCIKWIPKMEGVKAYIKIIRDDTIEPEEGATASQCYSGGAVEARLGAKRDTSAITHQLYHILCFGHEHDRSDRDNYVKFEGSGCKESTKRSEPTRGRPYDYMSIMHGACNGRNCLKSLDPDNVAVCGNSRLSVPDAENINEIYNCGKCNGHRWKLWTEITQEDSVPVYEPNHGNAPVHICRVFHNGRIIPGRGISSRGECLITLNGIEYAHKNLEEIQIFTVPRGVNMTMTPRIRGRFPTNAVRMGKVGTHQEFVLYMGISTRYGIMGTILDRDLNTLIVGDNGREYLIRNEFRVLTCQE